MALLAALSRVPGRYRTECSKLLIAEPSENLGSKYPASGSARRPHRSNLWSLHALFPAPIQRLVGCANVPGAVRIAVELIDTSSSNPRSLDLGSRAVLSSEPPEFSLNRPAVTEVLRYTIPSDSSLHQLHEIEVVFLPAQERDLGGARIDIQEFTLLPR